MVRKISGSLDWLVTKSYEEGLPATYIAESLGLLRRDVINHIIIKKKGFTSLHDYREYLARKKGFKSYTEYRGYLARKKGFKSYTEYQRELAKRKGFNTLYEYHRELAKNRCNRKENRELSNIVKEN